MQESFERDEKGKKSVNRGVLFINNLLFCTLSAHYMVN